MIRLLLRFQPNRDIDFETRPMACSALRPRSGVARQFDAARGPLSPLLGDRKDVTRSPNRHHGNDVVLAPLHDANPRPRDRPSSGAASGPSRRVDTRPNPTTQEPTRLVSDGVCRVNGRSAGDRFRLENRKQSPSRACRRASATSASSSRENAPPALRRRAPTQTNPPASSARPR